MRAWTHRRGATQAEVLRELARTQGVAFACDEGTAWFLVHASRWQGRLEVPAASAAVVFEEWLADHGLALIEPTPDAPHLARVARVDDGFRAALLAHAPYVPPAALPGVSDRAATWCVTAFRLEHLDPAAVAREVDVHPRSPPLTRALEGSPLLVAAGPGRVLAELAERIEALERAAAGN